MFEHSKTIKRFKCWWFCSNKVPLYTFLDVTLQIFTILSVNVKGQHSFRDQSAQRIELLSSKIKNRFWTAWNELSVIVSLSCLEDAVFCAAKAKALCRMKDEDVKSQWLNKFLHWSLNGLFQAPWEQRWCCNAYYEKM